MITENEWQRRYLKPIRVSEPKAVELAYRALDSGQVIVFPTDTLYGLLADVENPSAVERVFAVKKRPLHKSVPVLVSSFDMAQRYAVFTKVAEKLWKRFMPGPLTLVLPAKAMNIPGIVSREGKVGVRMPKYQPILEVIERLGRGVTGTSANISSEAAAKSFNELSSKLLEAVDAVFYDEKPLIGAPSTVVEVEEDGVKILRRGAISEEEIKSALRG